jgi:hypothetical protein
MGRLGKRRKAADDRVAAGIENRGRVRRFKAAQANEIIGQILR